MWKRKMRTAVGITVGIISGAAFAVVMIYGALWAAAGFACIIARAC